MFFDAAIAACQQRLCVEVKVSRPTGYSQTVNGWQPILPGMAKAFRGPAMASIKNAAIEARFLNTNQGFRLLGIYGKWSDSAVGKFSDTFQIVLRDGRRIHALDMKAIQPLVFSQRSTGIAGDAVLADARSGLNVSYHVELSNWAHYVRETFQLRPARDLDVASLILKEGGDQAKVAGTSLGSPVVTDQLFFGIEHPMAISEVGRFGWRCRINRKIPLKSGQTVSYSTVSGVAPKGQMRRAFLSYLERERPRPYAPFLHYNSWYDLGFFNKYTAKECVERIERFGQELTKKRGVQLSSFLFDDGWDDTSTVWKFHKGFPDKFQPLKRAAEKFQADPGIWLSPWGGYGGPREERLKAGAKAGLEIDSEGYALSGPKYYERFHDVCLDFVKKEGINQFKFDGTGSSDKQYPGSKFASDFEAAISLIHDLRVAQPDLFINLTTGTWPSPFWTRYADSIWRGGSDHSFAGVGPWREKWITYRDGDTYHGVVQKGPLYPLNSLMLHGLIYARYAEHLKDDPSGAFRHEVRSYFGSGTQLQEMYITPDKLNPMNWDDLAASADWSQKNADVLVDSHWVGGDPLNLEVYGWASWTLQKNILTLRNPSDHPQAFSIEPDRVFEVPEFRRGIWVGRKRFGDKQALKINTGKSAVVVLQPFEVQTFEGVIR